MHCDVCNVTLRGRGALPVSRAVDHCRFCHVQSRKLRFELLSKNYSVHNLQMIIGVFVIAIADACSSAATGFVRMFFRGKVVPLTQGGTSGNI